MDVGLLDAAEAARPADLVVRGGRLVNVFTEEIYPADVAVAGDRIVAVGDVSEYTGEATVVVDAAGRHLVPGLIDGHIHLECSKLSVTMFANAVVPLGHHGRYLRAGPDLRGSRPRGRSRVPG